MVEPQANPGQEQLRALVAQLEAGKARMEAMGKQIQMVEGSIIELAGTEGAINAIKTSKKGTEILVPLGSDSYAKASLSNTDSIIVGVGARLSVDKSISDAGETLEVRKKELESSLKTLQKSYLELSSKVSEINASAEGLVAELQGRQG